MRIGIFGTGMVGETLGSKLVSLDHEVKLGGREAKNDKGGAWAAKAGPKASYGTFAEAAAFGEIVFLCTKGEFAVDAAKSAAGALDGKILVDVTNPLDFSQGFPPVLSIAGTDSLGERVQAALPNAKVVKTLNTVACSVMVDPSLPGHDTDLFVSGNDADAKVTVTKFLREQLGWKSVFDLGDITTARGTESYLALWVRLFGVMKTGDFNIKIVRK
jgi:8-hydroxy-5-deazaflavin:NADPH oxidoreductase